MLTSKAVQVKVAIQLEDGTVRSFEMQPRQMQVKPRNKVIRLAETGEYVDTILEDRESLIEITGVVLDRPVAELEEMKLAFS